MKNKEFERLKLEASVKEYIYEPKYGGKDHSGYQTLMLYEVNYEREEAFLNGADWAYKYCMDEVVNTSLRLAEAKTEIASLKDTPGGKRIYGALNRIAELEIIAESYRAMLREIKEQIIDNPTYSSQIAQVAFAKITEAALKEK